MANAKQFSINLGKRAKELGINANKIKRKVALIIDQSLVLSTPVDTGLARSNWRVQLNAPAEGVIEAYSLGSRLGLNETSNASAAINQGSLAISQSQPGDLIYITNNVNYIGDLNRGTSAQAPASFVEIAIQDGIQAISREKLV